MSSGIEKALRLVRELPRVCPQNLRPILPIPRRKHRLGRHGGNRCGRGSKGQHHFNTLPPIGFEGGNTPFYLRIPKEPYYKDRHLKREYPPLSLLSLQRMIDLGRVDPKKPIDLTAICNARIVNIDPSKAHYGINLIDEGSDIFKAKVNIEVQWASEMTIAAIERNGGVIRTKFYSAECVEAMVNPENFFKRGLVIPRCKLPPKDAVEYYSDAKNRGYLADPGKILEERLMLSQKYGYEFIDITKDPDYKMLSMTKDPRQIWFGLEPGWAVNLLDKCIIKPTDEELVEYYKS